MLENRITLTIEEASAMTGIGMNTMRQLVSWKKIPILRAGRRFLIERKTLEEFLRMNEGRNLREKEDVLGMER